MIPDPLKLLFIIWGKSNKLLFVVSYKSLENGETSEGF